MPEQAGDSAPGNVVQQHASAAAVLKNREQRYMLALIYLRPKQARDLPRR